MPLKALLMERFWMIVLRPDFSSHLIMRFVENYGIFFGQFMIKIDV